MHITTIILTIGSALIAYTIGLVVYRLFFHPFAKYPGPFLAKISYFHAFYHALIKDTPLEQMRCHRKYGHVVRYGPNTLIFDQPAARNEIHGIGKNFKKGRSYIVANPTPEVPPNIAWQLDYKKHAQRKRIIQQAFSERALRESQVYIKPHIDTLCRIIADSPKADDGKWTQALDFHQLLYWLTQDVLTDMVFGRSYNMLTNAAQRNIGDVMLASLDRNHLAYQYPGLFKPGLNKWLDFGTWFMPNSFGDIMAYLNDGFISTTQRLESPPEDSEKRKDILSYLIDARDADTGEGIPKEEIVGEASMLHIGGASTMAGCLSLLFFYISRPRNAHVARNLANELRTRFTSQDNISLEEVEHCTYLCATVFEAIRFTAPHAFWREAQPGGGTITIPDGEADDIIPTSVTAHSSQTHFLPEGCVAGFCDYANVRNPNIYPDPDSFDPDRWIPTSDFYTSRGYDTETAQHIYERSKKATHSFSVGQRACIAQKFATAMMLLVVGNLAWRFDVKRAEGPEGDLGGGGSGKGNGRERKDEWQWYGSFTLEGDGPMVHFREV